MTELTQASHQWATRPDDQRFTSLLTLQDYVRHEKERSRARVISSRKLSTAPIEGDAKALVAIGPDGLPVNFTNHSFTQLASLAKSPAGYLRELHPALAADCLNYKLQTRAVEDIGVLLYKNGDAFLRAVTGPNYGRVWNAQVVNWMVDKFGDGTTGNFRVPGEFGKKVDVTKANTTLFASDRDMFVFLADEEHRVTIPGRRAGMHGDFARGFFVWNSEVGDSTLGICMFLFDYTCCNRIVWGVDQKFEVRIRHTSSAPDRWLEEAIPAIKAHANARTGNTVEIIKAAMSRAIGGPEKVDELLRKRFSKTQTQAIKMAHVADEGRPIETIWDAVTGATAYARGIEYQDARVAIEREAGKLLKLVA